MSADDRIREILKRYGEDFNENTWLVPGGKARAIKHPSIERMVAKAGITFEMPVMVRADPEMCVMIVKGSLRLDDERREEWSLGEASPKNNKNAYPYAMAEKRAKDRVALKLIGLHGLLYSEEEAEDFRERGAPSSQGPAPAQPLTIAVMAVEHMLSEIELCRGDLAELETLKAEDAFRKGYRNASKADQARILAALNPAPAQAAE